MTCRTIVIKQINLRKRRWAKADPQQSESAEALADVPEEVKMTTLLLEVDFILPSEISKGMSAFYFSLLGDAFWKRKFAFYFTKSYASFVDQKLELALTPKSEKITRRARRGDISKYESLLHLTVQIFTVPNIVPSLVSEGNLLGILINKLHSVFSNYIFKRAPAPSGTY